MRLAMLSLAFASLLALGTNLAVAQGVSANISTIPYVTSSAERDPAAMPVQWYTYRRPAAYGYYSYPQYYGYTYPNYGYTYQPYYNYSYQPQFNGYYTYPYSSYYYPNGTYYQAARPYYYRY
jgi:hypothetical protein